MLFTAVGQENVWATTHPIPHIIFSIILQILGIINQLSPIAPLNIAGYTVSQYFTVAFEVSGDDLTGICVPADDGKLGRS
jgi:hypothetical protein